MLKKLMEQRAEKQSAMQALLDKAKTENRAMTDEEQASFGGLEKEIRAIDATIQAEERARNLEPKDRKAAETVEEKEERAFGDYIMGVLEDRAGEQNFSMGNNGAIIPTTIANRIIKTVKDICPILARATIYNVKGTLKIPVYGKASTTHDITVAYQSEFTDITADAGQFTSIDLSGYLAGALTLIGKSVENNGSFSVVDFVVNQMAENIAVFLEGELLKGTGSSAAQGVLVGCTNTLTTAEATAITADELIELQAKVKTVYQANACWIMNSATFTVIRKLKDSQNRYLLQDNIAGEFPYMLLGKPVFLSDNMPTIAGGAKTVLYGDLSGLSVNFRENIQTQVLTEKYATMHAIGVVAWFEFDSKVTDNQKLAVLVQKAA